MGRLLSSRGMSRGLEEGKVTRFKGINKYTSVANIGPDQALDLLNVIVGPSGALEKFRAPVDLTGVIDGQPQGPESIFDFQQANGVRQYVVTIGSRVYRIDPTTFGINLIVDDPSFAGAVWDARPANNILFMCLAGRTMQKWTGTQFQNWGIGRPPDAPTVAVYVLPGPLGLTMNQGGRMYRYSWKNSVTGHIGTASPPSLSTGNIANVLEQVTAPHGPVDPQCDTIVWWCTLDGGGIFFYHSEQLVSAGLSIIDNGVNYSDILINKGRQAPLINDPPPVGNSLQLWLGRLFIFGLFGAPSQIAYTGYEKILEGRPEESCPPRNRLQLQIGADEIRGGGVIQAGIVAWSKSNEMYMLRGQVEDIIVTAPLQLTAFLEQLPFNIGLFATLSVQQTPAGLMWLASDLTVQVFDGNSRPKDVSSHIYPLLRRITPGAQAVVRSATFDWMERNWYCLLIPIDGSGVCNRIIFWDLTDDPDTNAGVFVVDIQADCIAVVEDPNGQRKLVIGQQGKLRELTLPSLAENALHPVTTSTSAKLNAFWKSGWGTGERPDLYKMFRYLDLVATNSGCRINVNIVDDNFEDINHIELGPVRGRATIGAKGRRLQVEIIFPSEDVDISVLELRVAAKITGQR